MPSARLNKLARSLGVLVHVLAMWDSTEQKDNSNAENCYAIRLLWNMPLTYPVILFLPKLRGPWIANSVQRSMLLPCCMIVELLFEAHSML